VAAYSDEFIQDRVQELIEEFDSEEEREEEWEKFMSTLAKDIAYIYDQNPPENLVDQLGDL
jgi:predicted ATPase